MKRSLVVFSRHLLFALFVVALSVSGTGIKAAAAQLRSSLFARPPTPVSEAAATGPDTDLLQSILEESEAPLSDAWARGRPAGEQNALRAPTKQELVPKLKRDVTQAGARKGSGSSTGCNPNAPSIEPEGSRRPRPARPPSHRVSDGIDKRGHLSRQLVLSAAAAPRKARTRVFFRLPPNCRLVSLSSALPRNTCCTLHYDSFPLPAGPCSVHRIPKQAVLALTFPRGPARVSRAAAWCPAGGAAHRDRPARAGG